MFPAVIQCSWSSVDHDRDTRLQQDDTAPPLSTQPFQVTKLPLSISLPLFISLPLSLSYSLPSSLLLSFSVCLSPSPSLFLSFSPPSLPPSNLTCLLCLLPHFTHLIHAVYKNHVYSCMHVHACMGALAYLSTCKHEQV